MYGLAILTAFAVAGTTSAIVYAQAKAPDSVVLKGSPMGGVKLDHAKHAKDYGAKCTDCHHAAKPEKAMKTPQEKCSDCHVKVAAAPMKTTYRDAFHDTMAKKGTCVDCHVKATAAGKKTAPTSKCTDCHKKENA
jgi:sRNA-binding protein